MRVYLALLLKDNDPAEILYAGENEDLAHEKARAALKEVEKKHFFYDCYDWMGEVQTWMNGVCIGTHSFRMTSGG